MVFVSVEDYNIVGVGRDKAEAMKNYKDALESGGSSLEIDESDEFDKELEGTVKRIAADTKNGNTVYYLTLDTDEGNIFYATSKISKELPLTKEGDKIKITFSKDEKDVIEIDEFDNYNIGKIVEKKEETKPEDKKSEENKTDKKETTDKVETKEQ